MVSFLKRSFSTRPVIEIAGQKVCLRTPTLDDYESWAKLREQSRAFLVPWEPPWQLDELSRAAFRQRLRRGQRDLEADETYPFFLFRTSDRQLLGGLTLSNIRRGVAQMASLGYWMGQPYAGQHYMSAAVRLAMQFAFTKLELRRMEAACLPENASSIRLLTEIGFRQEGLARSYLNIAGSWRDHLLFGLLAADFNDIAHKAVERRA